MQGEQVLLRTYLRSADRTPFAPTDERLVKLARRNGLAGATVLRGILGYGSRGIIKYSNWALVQHVPIIVEIVDSPEKIAQFVAGPVDELMQEGMITLERAHVMAYRHGRDHDVCKLSLGGVLQPLSTLPQIEAKNAMKINEQGVLLRVFIGESDRIEHRPLHEVIVHKVRELGLAGATVLRGVEGYGAHSVVHRANLVETSTDLPIVLEIVDTEEKIGLLLPHLEQMVKEGMITMEHVMILLYRHGEKKPNSAN